MAIDITPEVRQAVYEADCAETGHRVDPMGVFSYSKTVQYQQIGSEDELKLPHMKCLRCGRVWIVCPLDGADYEDAERQLYSMMEPKNPEAKKITRRRARRIARAAEEIFK